MKEYHFSCIKQDKKNGILIACAIVMQKLDVSPKRAFKLLGIEKRKLKYRNINRHLNAHGAISVLHCLKALKLAAKREILPFPLDSFPIAAWNFW
jgi:hypothetical protein